jgi:DNA modification methylase
MTVRILEGDVRARLRDLPDESVHCVVTSPPYWGLRDYGVAGQLGLEASPEEYVTAMTEVFRDVRRVLRKDGILWLNIGDCYAGGYGFAPDAPCNVARANGERWGALNPAKMARHEAKEKPKHATKVPPGLKPKDLVGMPWRVAFALQADGWWLRSEIIWHKPNPMPESVTDRPTKAHEQVFLFAKSVRYYYDADAVREPAHSAWDPDDAKSPDGWATHEGSHGTYHREGREKGKSGNKARKPPSARGVPVDTDGRSSGAVAGSVPWEGTSRNLRSVWTIATEPFPGAHFATYPTKLVEPCIKAGCPAGGTVLDPFGGAGTTGLVADRLGRNAILIELNPEYAEIARRRITGDCPLFTEVL